MKEVEATYYCDATGDEIDEPFDMLTVELEFSYGSGQLSKRHRTLHLSPDAHALEYPRCDDNTFTAFVDPDGDVCMLKEETGGGRVWYHGYGTTDDAVRDVMDTVHSILDGDSE